MYSQRYFYNLVEVKKGSHSTRFGCLCAACRSSFSHKTNRERLNQNSFQCSIFLWVAGCWGWRLAVIGTETSWQIQRACKYWQTSHWTEKVRRSLERRKTTARFMRMRNSYDDRRFWLPKQKRLRQRGIVSCYSCTKLLTQIGLPELYLAVESESKANPLPTKS